MDRFLSPRGVSPGVQKGGAYRALPFFVCLVLGVLGASLNADAPASFSSTDGNLDLGARTLYTPASVLNGPAASAGFPKTGGLWLLWGGGATLTPGPLRVQVSAWKGSLNAASQGSATDWQLDLAALTLEQAYPVDNFLFTVGASLEGGQLDGAFVRGGSLTGTQAALFGYNAQAGVRWPAQTSLAFFLRGGWEMLAGPGTWHGNDAGNLGSTLFELGGPTATLQLELTL